MSLPVSIVEAFLASVPESHFFTVVFSKKDGSSRRMHCRRDVKVHLAGGKSTTKDHPDLVTVYETNNDYRSFDKSRVLFLRGDGMTLGTEEGFKAAVAQEATPSIAEVDSSKAHFRAVVNYVADVKNILTADDIERRLVAAIIEDVSAGIATVTVEEVPA